MTKVLVGLWGLAACCVPLSVAADEGRGDFSKLGFLKGTWEGNVKVADRTVELSGVTFATTLNGKFFQVDYAVGAAEKKKTHRVMVGPGDKGRLQAWTFTSDGKTYESVVAVKAVDKGCELTVITGKDSVTLKFNKMSDEGFTLEYYNKGKSIGPLTTTFRKGK